MKSKFVLSPKEEREILSAREKAKTEGDHRLQRRLRGLLLVGSAGKTHVEAAEILEVETAIVFHWQRDYREGGVDALRSKPIPGRPSRLTDAQLKQFAAIVEAGPEAAGLDTGVWTGPILADVVRKKFGVRYSASQVRRILHKLGFSLQYPKKKLARADLAAQEKWVTETLPAIQKQVIAEAGVLFL